MRKYVLIVTFVTFCSSCASIFNSRDTTVRIITESPAELQFRDDTLGERKIRIDNYVDLTVPRSKDTLSFKLTNDSVSRDVFIPSKDNEMSYVSQGINFLAGLTGCFSAKRYTYDSPKYYRSDLTDGQFATLSGDLPTDNIVAKSQSGNIYLSVSLPYVNYFNLSPEGESRKDSWGFFGLSFGIDYYYKNRSFISATLSGVRNYEIPIPIVMDHDDGGQTEDIYSLGLVLADNHRFNWFSFGYGISCSRNLWKLVDRDNSNLSKTRGNTSLGLHFNSYFYLYDSGFVGITYRPSYFRIDSDNKHKYECVLSLDIGMKINLSHRK